MTQTIARQSQENESIAATSQHDYNFCPHNHATANATLQNDFLMNQIGGISMKKLGDNKIHILRPATEQRMRIPSSNSQILTKSDNSFFILGSVRNLAE